MARKLWVTIEQGSSRSQQGATVTDGSPGPMSATSSVNPWSIQARIALPLAAEGTPERIASRFKQEAPWSRLTARSSMLWM